MHVSPKTLSETALSLGFAMVGFARLHRLDEREDFYRRWLDEGGHASMDYLEREPERTFDPRRLGWDRSEGTPCSSIAIMVGTCFLPRFLPAATSGRARDLTASIAVPAGDASISVRLARSRTVT